MAGGPSSSQRRPAGLAGRGKPPLSPAAPCGRGRRRACLPGESAEPGAIGSAVLSTSPEETGDLCHQSSAGFKGSGAPRRRDSHVTPPAPLCFPRQRAGSHREDFALQTGQRDTGTSPGSSQRGRGGCACRLALSKASDPRRTPHGAPSFSSSV